MRTSCIITITITSTSTITITIIITRESFRAIIRGLGLLFYLLLGFRYGIGPQCCSLSGGSIWVAVQELKLSYTTPRKAYYLLHTHNYHGNSASVPQHQPSNVRTHVFFEPTLRDPSELHVSYRLKGTCSEIGKDSRDPEPYTVGIHRPREE